MISTNLSPRTAPPSPEGRPETLEYKATWQRIFCSQISSRLHDLLNSDTQPPLPKWRTRAELYHRAGLESPWMSPTPSTTETRSPNISSSSPQNDIRSSTLSSPQSDPSQLIKTDRVASLIPAPLPLPANKTISNPNLRRENPKRDPILSISHNLRPNRKVAKHPNAPRGITKLRLRELPSCRRTHRMVLRSTTMRNMKNG
ncbi:hypothetical protein BCIN_17g00065 [Botrytis cinerea B05.10]|uniref:Uncharacterized protein n=1 Tax=Botryotinia fuckeliana (strain B05.10) TaxID=332648 RepID=A0A384K7R9_BOTFB|nr:hypothetical protein BCIN_17g00065 [Botrytis cinerea B05.10]ATZ58870.1 hypothetical protein BCIN_17g00065 [Botrytis cinerea B05.10]